MTTTQIGDLVTGKGVYVGIDKINHVTKEAYFEPDFLRDASGKQLILNFSKAGDVLAKRNGGRRYGNGSELAVRKAIASGEYKDGDLVMPPREFLNGLDAKGDKVRSDNLVSLLRTGAVSLKEIRQRLSFTIKVPYGNLLWSLSGTEYLEDPSYVYYTGLADGCGALGAKDVGVSGVVPLRFFSPAP